MRCAARTFQSCNPTRGGEPERRMIRLPVANGHAVMTMASLRGLQGSWIGRMYSS